MKIVVIGTSNSVMGNKGYIQALRLEHDVIQMSTGRTPFYSAINKILINRDIIESCDLLIIDHYVNDVNFYGDILGDEYRSHLRLFYQYLSSLNVNILNILFPIIDLPSMDSFDLYELTLSLCKEYNISILDLNTLELDKSFFKDPLHLTHDVSYALGLSLNQNLTLHDWPSVAGGKCIENPFSILSAQDLTSSGTVAGKFENSLVTLDYIELLEEITIERDSGDQLIAIGLIRDKYLDGCSGFKLNRDREFSISGFGYFLEAMVEKTDGDFTLSPVFGNKELEHLVGRETVRGHFSYCYICDMLFFNKNKTMKFSIAEKKAKNIEIKSFIKIARRLININNNQLPSVSPKSVNKLRDLALSLEEKDLALAKDFMLLASVLRPEGPLIRKKLRAYEKALSQQQTVKD